MKGLIISLLVVFVCVRLLKKLLAESVLDTFRLGKIMFGINCIIASIAGAFVIWAYFTNRFPFWVSIIVAWVLCGILMEFGKARGNKLIGIPLHILFGLMDGYLLGYIVAAFNGSFSNGAPESKKIITFAVCIVITTVISLLDYSHVVDDIL